MGSNSDPRAFKEWEWCAQDVFNCVCLCVGSDLSYACPLTGATGFYFILVLILVGLS